MNTESLTNTIEIAHKDHNLDKKENLQELPAEKAVFGIFATVHDEPVNCRYIGYAENLRETIRTLFENPQGEGMKKFMQGPWIKILRFELMPKFSEAERQKLLEVWTQTWSPAIDDDGEYPGYYNY